MNNCHDEIRKYWRKRIAKLGVPVEITEPVKGECGTAVGMLLPVADTEIKAIEMKPRSEGASTHDFEKVWQEAYERLYKEWEQERDELLFGL